MTLFGTSNGNHFDGAETATGHRKSGSRQTGAAAAGTARSGQRGAARTVALLAASGTALALSACGQSSSKSYDISPIFPLSANKCAKYDGKSEGSGFSAHCWVTKEKCQQAASDWRQAMQSGGVSDAIEFSC